MFSKKRPPTPADGPRFRTVFVVGLAHCGSTLLARILGMHPEVLSVGQLLRVRSEVERDGPCTCGEPLSRCPFWGPRLAGLREATGFDWKRFDVDTYHGLALGAGRKLAFDVSKTLAWRRTRWWGDRGEGYVVLIRDSRGILASAVRHERPLPHQLKKHVKWMQRLAAFARKRGERAIVLHYEDLCREPERELRRLCTFLRLPFAPEMLRPSDGVHHLVHASSSGYLKGSNDIRLDERWRRELAPGTLAEIEDAMEGLEIFRGRFQRTTPAGSKA